MKKDFTRDYVTEAFRLYAAMGKPTYEEAQRKVYEMELSKRSDKDPSVAVAQAEKAVKNNMPLLLDILAVDKTIELLERGEKRDAVKAVEAVYFTKSHAPLHRGDISERVRYYAMSCPTDERTVYRWLKEARLLCAAVRGLRITDTDTKKFRIVL